MKIWKLLSALVVHGALFVAVPYLLSQVGLIAQLRWQAYVVLAVTWIGLGLKLLFGDVVSDKFEYHKHGYDFCNLTMGTALSMLSLQMLSNTDVLPGIPDTGPWAVLAIISSDRVRQRVALLTALFILTCFLTLLTARISRAVVEPTTKAKNLLSLLNFGIGASAFGAYLFLLLAKV
jgi:hypothetical protein